MIITFPDGSQIETSGGAIQIPNDADAVTTIDVGDVESCAVTIEALEGAQGVVEIRQKGAVFPIKTALTMSFINGGVLPDLPTAMRIMAR